MVSIPVQLINKHATIPTTIHKGDACADLHSTDCVTIEPGQIKLVSTGCIFELPIGYEGQIRPRSGLALKHGMTVLNSPGTIDSGYRGEIKVIVANFGQQTFEINIGDRIAQIAIRPIPETTFIEVTDVSETKRGEGGFGSTGINMVTK